jgi:hypothetical protein
MKLLNLVLLVASTLWLGMACYYSWVGNYEQAIYSLLWSMVTSMPTRWDNVR